MHVSRFRSLSMPVACRRDTHYPLYIAI